MAWHMPDEVLTRRPAHLDPRQTATHRCRNRLPPWCAGPAGCHSLESDSLARAVFSAANRSSATTAWRPAVPMFMKVRCGFRMNFFDLGPEAGVGNQLLLQLFGSRGGIAVASNQRAHGSAAGTHAEDAQEITPLGGPLADVHVGQAACLGGIDGGNRFVHCFVPNRRNMWCCVAGWRVRGRDQARRLPRSRSAHPAESGPLEPWRAGGLVLKNSP